MIRYWSPWSRPGGCRQQACCCNYFSSYQTSGVVPPLNTSLLYLQPTCFIHTGRDSMCVWEGGRAITLPPGPSAAVRVSAGIVLPPSSSAPSYLRCKLMHRFGSWHSTSHEALTATEHEQCLKAVWQWKQTFHMSARCVCPPHVTMCVCVITAASPSLLTVTSLPPNQDTHTHTPSSLFISPHHTRRSCLLPCVLCVNPNVFVCSECFLVSWQPTCCTSVSCSTLLSGGERQSLVVYFTVVVVV